MDFLYEDETENHAYNWSHNFEDVHIHNDENYDWAIVYDDLADGDSLHHHGTYKKFLQYQHRRRIVYGFLLILLIIIGLIGNILVIVTSVRKSKKVNSAFYIFLVNLSAASLILLGFEYPLLLYENVFTQPWKMGKVFCQLHGYIQYCAFYGVAYALVLVLVFRLLQITIPDRISPFNNTCIASIICVIKWIVILLSNIPTWIGHGLYDEIEGSSFCYHKQLNENKGRLHKYLILHFIFAFTLPVVIMVSISGVLILSAMKYSPGSHYGNVSNSSQLQRNTTIMLISLIIAFIVCWGPSNIFIILLGFDYYNLDNFLSLSIMSDIFMTFACSNPCVNPWLIFLALKSELMNRNSHSSSNGGGQGRQGSVQSNGTLSTTFGGDNNASVVGGSEFGDNNDQTAFVTDIEMNTSFHV